MTGSRPRIYWDASCFLDYVQSNPQWIATLRTLLDEANVHGSIEIVTSVLSVTEVAFTAMERADRALSAAEESRLDRFWSASPGITLVEFNERVGRFARAIRREDMVRRWKGYRTPDIIHLATAQYAGVTEMHTTDALLHRYGPIVGFPVRYPATPQQRSPA
jgi:predicted nucleic acid-binding protein